MGAEEKDSMCLFGLQAGKFCLSELVWESLNLRLKIQI